MATTEIDSNYEGVAKAVNDDNTSNPVPLLVDPTTNMLLVDIEGNLIGVVWNELLGIGDDVTTDFVLDYTPQEATSIYECWVGGARKFLTDDFTLNTATKTISFITVPRTGQKVRVTYQPV